MERSVDEYRPKATEIDGSGHQKVFTLQLEQQATLHLGNKLFRCTRSKLALSLPVERHLKLVFVARSHLGVIDAVYNGAFWSKSSEATELEVRQHQQWTLQSYL